MSDAGDQIPDRMATAAAYDQNRRTQPPVPQTEEMANARRMAALKALQNESGGGEPTPQAPAASDPGPATQPAKAQEPAATQKPASETKAAASSSASGSAGDDNQKLILIGVAVLVLVLVIVLAVG